MKKRILSLLVCLTMVLTMIPSVVFAETTEASAVAAVAGKTYSSINAAIDATTATDKTVKLLVDVNENNITIDKNQDVIIDLNQKTVNGYFWLEGKAVIKNGKIDSTTSAKSAIEINNENDRTWTPSLSTENLEIVSGRHGIRVDGGIVNINGGSYTAADDPSVHAVNISDGGNVTIKDGTFIGNNQNGSGCIAMRDSSSTLKIEKGTFSGGNQQGSLTVWAGEANVTGGTFESVWADTTTNLSGNVTVNGNIRIQQGTITGGTYNGEITGQGRFISGGTFVNDPSAYVVKEKAGKLVNGTYTVVPAVAQIGEQGYASLADAVAAAKSGDEVVLVSDVSDGDGVVIDKNITINLNGHEYVAVVPLVGSTGTKTNGFQILADAKNGHAPYDVTIKNGTLKYGSDKNGMLIQNYSNLTLDDVDLAGNANTKYVVSNNNGDTEFMNGTTITATEGNVAFDVYYGGATSAYKNGVTVNVGDATINGTIEVAAESELAENADFGIEFSENATINGTIDMAAGSEHADVTKNGNVTVNVPTGYDWDENGNLVKVVAKVGNKTYQTLTEAVAAAKAGDKVVMLSDAAGSGIVIDKEITIDFGGFTYTIKENPLAGSNGTKTQCFQLLKEAKKVKFENGSIIADNKDIAMIIQNYSNLTLENMNLDATKGENSLQYVLSNNYGETVIGNGTVITGNNNAKAFDVYYWPESYGNVKVTVDGATINGDIEIAGSKAVADNHEFTLVIEAGTVNGKLAFGENAGSATITKAAAVEITAPENYEWAKDANGKDVLAAKYTIEFNSNGATGSMNNIEMVDGVAKPLPNNTFVYNNYKFAGWSTKLNGPVEYADGSAVTTLGANAGDKVNLYAIWTEKEVLNPTLSVKTVDYNGAPQTFVLEGYEISYQQNGKAVDNPINAGVYDVVLHRDGDENTVEYNYIFAGGLVINKVDPEVEWPENLSGTTGTKLSTVALGTGFTWVNPDQEIQSGNNEYEVVYTPDNANYNTITNKITVAGKDVVYKITEGVEQEVVKGETASFTSDAPFGKFVYVMVDGVELSEDEVEVIEGSTKATLKGEFTNTLAIGEHSITIVSTDGQASTTFTVKAPEQNPPAGGDSGNGTTPTDKPAGEAQDKGNAQTGDDFNMAIPFMLALMALAGMGAAVVARKRNTN